MLRLRPQVSLLGTIRYVHDDGGRNPRDELRVNSFEVNTSRQAGADVVVDVVKNGGWYEVNSGLEVVYGGGDG